MADEPKKKPAKTRKTNAQKATATSATTDQNDNLVVSAAASELAATSMATGSPGRFGEQVGTCQGV